MTPEDNDAHSEIAALKSQIFTLLIALIVVSGTLTVYLFRQTSLTGKDLKQDRQALANMGQHDAAITAFVKQLEDYGQKHPDFKTTVLAKYGIASPSGK